MDYSEYDLHLNLINEMDEDDSILAGVAIKHEDLASFLFDFNQLCVKYGVDYLELLDKDAYDTSAEAAVRLDMAADESTKIDDTITVEPTGEMRA